MSVAALKRGSEVSSREDTTKRSKHDSVCDDNTVTHDAATVVVVPLHVRYPHRRDTRVVFEEVGHVYKVDWYDDGVFTSTGITSATSLYKPYFEEFQSDVVIANMRAGKKWTTSKYFGLSDDEIKQRWVDAANAGGRHHLLCENYYNGVPPPLPHATATTQFLQFADDHKHLEPFRTEWVLFSEDAHRVCGTPDMVYKSEKAPEAGTLFLTIYDWKNCNAITRYSRLMGNGVFDDVRDCNYFHYAIQLNIYKYLLEEHYGDMTVDGVVYERIRIDAMYIIVMHESRDTYLKLLLPDYQDRIRQVFQERRHQRASQN